MTTTHYHALIPTIGLSPYLLPLLETLLADEHCLFIDLPDNGSTDEPHGLTCQLLDSDLMHPEVLEAIESGRIMRRRTSGTIYRSWNEAMDAARYTPVAILNDDVVLAPGSIREALRHLSRTVPVVGLEYRRRVAEGAVEAPLREVSGTFKDGGLGGFAFVVLPDYAPRVDPGYQWWYGDDDLVRKTLRLKRTVAVATGAPVDHPRPSLSGNQMGWLNDAVRDDHDLWNKFVAGG